jgi:hypothetical protein
MIQSCENQHVLVMCLFRPQLDVSAIALKKGSTPPSMKNPNRP